MTGFTIEQDENMMNEINMIPFIDVMLVLLIVFIITVPVITHSVDIELPQASSTKEVIQPETLNLTIRADGSYWLDDAEIADDELDPRLQAAAANEPQPELHIRGDQDVRYQHVARAMATAQRAGLTKIGFVTEPSRANDP